MKSDYPRYLTKSRFKAALTCPTKLFYTGKPEYANSSQDDEFMRSLAEGGFQVGELAKLMYPEGVEVLEKGHEAALERTQALLQEDKVTIFEAAIRYQNLFVRIDVLKKAGRHFELTEVKAKSCDPHDPRFFTGANGKLNSAMLPYLQDVAFQKFVLAAAYPGTTVSSYLMMADKTACATTDQVSQHFKICREGKRSWVEVPPGVTAETIGAALLTAAPVSVHVEEILATPLTIDGACLPFSEAVKTLASNYERDEQFAPRLGGYCKQCEFKMAAPDPRSGFHACWSQAGGLAAADFARGTILDVWYFTGKAALMRNGIFKMSQLTEQDLKVKPGIDGMSRSERQWMQVSGNWPGGGECFLDREGLKRQLASWRYPLHFIDFETSRAALPFHQGRRPYEQVAFQFSHHVMHADGSIEHAGQFLQAQPGVFPNYAFVRELRRQLIGDDGTILRWASHENSVLRDIWKQLESDPQAPADKDALQDFILSITTEGARIGERTMVDLCKMAERYYFHPLTKGSCSIKKVLPAVLASSPFLCTRYAAKVYGSPGGIPSLNFKDWAWWQASDNRELPCDPYTLLPPVFADLELQGDLDEEESLSNGGAAMVAYARLQFEKISAEERARLEAALLKYCELDTLAMVMILQAWQATLADA